MCREWRGLNGSVINLIYDYVSAGRRTCALALQQALAGLAGFLTTSLVSLLVEYIQKNGCEIFGRNIYAQQILSLISCLFAFFLVIYMLTVVKKIQRNRLKSLNAVDDERG